MIKAIVLTIIVVFGLFDILLMVGCLRLEKKQDEYEAYERWKEEQKKSWNGGLIRSTDHEDRTR